MEQKLCKLVTTVGLFKTVVLFFIGFSYGELTLSYLAITSNFAWFAHTHTHTHRKTACVHVYSISVADPGFWKAGFSSNSTQPKAVHRGV